MYLMLVFFFFKQKTAYEMRISDWSSDVCSSDLSVLRVRRPNLGAPGLTGIVRIGDVPLPTYDLALIVIGPLVLASLWLLFNRTRWGIKIGRASVRERVCQDE